MVGAPVSTTWPESAGTTPPPKASWPRGVIVACVLPAALLPVLGVGCLLLSYSGIAFLDGPSRGIIAREGESLVIATTGSFNPRPIVGTATASFHSCGHLDGVGQLQYTGDIDVPISGVAPADHARVEDVLTAASDRLSRQDKGRAWAVTVFWTSRTATTGIVEASVTCTDISS